MSKTTKQDMVFSPGLCFTTTRKKKNCLFTRTTALNPLQQASTQKGSGEWYSRERERKEN